LERGPSGEAREVHTCPPPGIPVEPGGLTAGRTPRLPRLRAVLSFLDARMNASSHHGDRAILTLRASTEPGGESIRRFFAAGAGPHAAALPHAACLRWCEEEQRWFLLDTVLCTAMRGLCWAGLCDLFLDAFTVDHLYLSPVYGRGEATICLEVATEASLRRQQLPVHLGQDAFRNSWLDFDVDAAQMEVTGSHGRIRILPEIPPDAPLPPGMMVCVLRHREEAGAECVALRLAPDETMGSRDWAVEFEAAPGERLAAVLIDAGCTAGEEEEARGVAGLEEAGAVWRCGAVVRWECEDERVCGSEEVPEEEEPRVRVTRGEIPLQIVRSAVAGFIKDGHAGETRYWQRDPAGHDGQGDLREGGAVWQSTDREDGVSFMLIENGSEDASLGVVTLAEGQGACELTWASRGKATKDVIPPGMGMLSRVRPF